MILGGFDWVVDSKGRSRCIDMVDRVAAAGSTRVNFVPTHYWMDNFLGSGISAYAYKDMNGNWAAFNAQAIWSFAIGMQLCFAHAVQLGMDIAIVPHLDNAVSDLSINRKWRNGLVFDPTKPFGNLGNAHSYSDVMLTPLAEALHSAMGKNTKVWMSMQGEMSATLLYYPAQYAAEAKRLHGIIVKGLGGSVSKNVKMGVSFNFNKLDAPNDSNPGSSAGGVLAQLLYGIGNRLDRRAAPTIDKNKIRGLLNMVDFIGISAYAPLPTQLQPSDMQNSAYDFFKEFQAFGLDVQALIVNRGIEFHYSEMGLGGGGSLLNSQPAASAAEAARNPFQGINGGYTAAGDPFRNNPQVGTYQRSYFDTTLKWLDQGGGPSVQLHACFLWSIDSWDVLGVYPASTSSQGSFRNEAIAAEIRTHNLRVAKINGVRN